MFILCLIDPLCKGKGISPRGLPTNRETAREGAPASAPLTVSREKPLGGRYLGASVQIMRRP